MTANDKKIYSALEAQSRSLIIALGFRDQSTLDHSDRVQELAAALAERAGLCSSEISALRVSSRFHDIGKIGIPDNILRKPGKLDSDEWLVMHQHPLIGQQIVEATELQGALQTGLIIRHHHEHFNGSGYPDRLAGEKIPVGARIISIVDSYDAMAFPRSYHQGHSHTEIMDIIESESGIKHDPQLIKHFHRVIERSRLRV